MTLFKVAPQNRTYLWNYFVILE